MLFYEPLFLFLFFPRRSRCLPGWCGARPCSARLPCCWSPACSSICGASRLSCPSCWLTCVADYAARPDGDAGRRGWAGRAGHGRADQPRHAGVLQIHRVRGRQPRPAASGGGPGAVECRPGSRCRSACPSSCSRRSPTWSTSPAAVPARRRGSPPTCCTSSCSPSCWPARSSNTTSWRPSCSPMGRSRSGDLVEGFRRFMLGVVKKTILADTLASGADMSFAADPARLGFADAWWGVLFFTFQIYIDFSAYSDMAIGLARMFGFRLNENFNKPYISRAASPSSGGAGTSRCPPGFATTFTSRLAATGCRPGGAIVNLWALLPARADCGMALLGPTSPGAPITASSWCWSGLFLLRWLDRMPRGAANAWHIPRDHGAGLAGVPRRVACRRPGHDG